MSTEKNYIIKAQASEFFNGVDFLVVDTVGARRAVGVKIIFAEVDNREPVKPTFGLTRSAAQSLFNDLYKAGFRYDATI